MTIAFVVSGQGHSTTSNGFTTGSIDTTGANFIIVGVSLGNAISAGTLSDSKSNTWTGLTQYAGGFTDRYFQFFYCQNPTVGTGHTFSITGTANFPSLCIAAFSGVSTSPFDVANNNPGGFSNSVTTGSVTPGSDNELLIAGLAYDDNTNATIDSSFTLSEVIPEITFGWSGNAIAYLIETTATAKNPTFSWTNGSRGMGTIATFKASAGVSFIAKSTLINQTTKRASYF